MTFRWLIRSFTIALLTLCLGLWAWSYFRYFSIAYNPSPGKCHFMDTYTGGVLFGSTNGIDWSPPGWRLTHNHHVQPLLELPVGKRFLNFGYFRQGSTPANTVWGLGIPFWFPSLLFTGLLWFVWRQTRPKPAWRGFPVEVTQPSQ
ncbi:MAG: hypothetical protein FWD53_01345 [Phycisphaerales bacterium]|nr:hypothetical protein [Phycisphaerales bacterium]